MFGHFLLSFSRCFFDRLWTRVQTIYVIHKCHPHILKYLLLNKTHINVLENPTHYLLPPPLLPPPPPPRQNCRPQSGDEGSSGGPLPPHFPLRAATRRAGPGPGRQKREKRGKRAGGHGRWRSSGTHGCSRWVGQRISSMTPPDLRPPPPVPLLQPPPLVPGWGGGSLSP